MTYIGHVTRGVVVFEGPQRPPEGTMVRVEEMQVEKTPVGTGQNWGDVFKDLIGAVENLPADMADNHDHYIHGTPKR